MMRIQTLVQWVGLMMAILVLAGCSLIGGNEAEAMPEAVPVLGSDVELQGQAFLSCSATCANRGQCGTLDSGQRVVLLGAPDPMVQFHNRMANDQTAVTINGVQELQVQTLNTGALYPLRFYQISLPENPEPAWVAGWCLRQ